MTRPADGLLWGTTKRKRASPAAARSRTVSSKLLPPSVRLATTRISFIGCALSSFAGGSDDARTGCGGSGSGCGRGRGEDGVNRAGYSVLVWTADDRRNPVEVEDRRRRGYLPLERQAAPRIADGSSSPAPAGDHVVDEHLHANGAHHGAACHSAGQP